MSDEPFYAPFRTPAPPRQPKSGELLFEFVRGYRFRHPVFLAISSGHLIRRW